ncbi:MAG TPA: ATP-binding protein [Candidatus Acidoferrum sp.]|jgi:two-component system NtrC family sensor kinase|nr:ATP-binding protein [Candidatus Acidoferrum sp.]
MDSTTCDHTEFVERPKPSWKTSFSTKVLVPVVSIMVLLVVLTGWSVNRRLTKQFRLDAARSLETADSVFRSSENLHAKNLLLRFRNLPNEPPYKGAFQSKNLQTLRDAIKDLPTDQGVDVALFTSSKADLQASAQRDPRLPLGDFQVNSAAASKKALTGELKADTIRVGDRLFDLVSIPVFGSSGIPIFGGGGSSVPIGVLTVGSEIGDSLARELSLVTHSQIVLLANGHVVASTIPGMELRDQFARLFSENIAERSRRGGPREVLLGDDHYFCAAGNFSSLNGDAGLGYLLLSSYEEPLRALRSTQQMLVLVSLVGILLGTLIVGLLVRKVTEPLRQLQASAEAVGRGDYSHHVEVSSNDECGELARVFNRMTDRVKRSRGELERTVTTLKATQAQLVQSEKLSGIGEFVAGVAHELNNPLTSVMGFSELLAQAPGHPNQGRYLELVFKSAQRCQKIVQNLLHFARLHPPERRLANVNTLVEGAVEFMQYQLRTSNIQIITRLDPKLPDAMLDSHQMQQVFLNIINNARQAIEAKGNKGRVLITTESLPPRMRITFEDDGPGIPAENLPKLFDPFFTTKEIGKGTGLGLSLCYGVISEHGGTIQVRSKPGEGAAFVLDLPLVTGADGKPLHPLAPAPQLADAKMGLGKKVLVIDDEEPILEMVRSELTQHGYQVDVVQDGEAALRCLDQTQYDLALCDWKMPGLNGGDVYERLQASHPALCERFVFITGDVISDKVQRFLKERRKSCLTKPFSLAEFRVAVEQALRIE